jgi:zinc finger HIT domain-containing protein 1
MSQKTFRNYLDDEEAALAQAPSATPRANVVKAIRMSAPSPRASAPATPKAEQGPESHFPCPVPPSKPHVVELMTSEFDNDPLLRSYIPTAPSERIMQALLSEPPLSYSASRATLAAGEKPLRHFCSICGYWGRVRCMKCGARTCGLDCYRIHEETRCDRFYA